MLGFTRNQLLILGTCLGMVVLAVVACTQVLLPFFSNRPLSMAQIEATRTAYRTSTVVYSTPLPPTPMPTIGVPTSIPTVPSAGQFTIVASPMPPTVAPAVIEARAQEASAQSENGSREIIEAAIDQGTLLLALYPYLIIGFFLVRLGWMEVYYRFQTGDFTTAFICGAVFIGSLFFANNLSVPLLIIGIGAVAFSCMVGKPDFSPLGFYFGGVGMVLFLLDKYQQIILPQQQVIGIGLIGLAMAITVFEISREKNTVQAIVAAAVYALIQFGAYSLGKLMGQNPLLFVMIGHTILMSALTIFDPQINRRFLFPIAPAISAGGGKIPHLVPADPLILINYILLIMVMGSVIV